LTETEACLPQAGLSSIKAPATRATRPNEMRAVRIAFALELRDWEGSTSSLAETHGKGIRTARILLLQLRRW